MTKFAHSNYFSDPIDDVSRFGYIVRMEANKMKYRAHVEIDGKSLIVFPRSKKTSLFDTIEAAEHKLNQISKRLTHNARGFVSDMTGAIVLTIAL